MGMIDTRLRFTRNGGQDMRHGRMVTLGQKGAFILRTLLVMVTG